MDFLSGGFLFLIQSLARSTVPSKPLTILFLVLLLFSGSLQENIEKKNIQAKGVRNLRSCVRTF